MHGFEHQVIQAVAAVARFSLDSCGPVGLPTGHDESKAQTQKAKGFKFRRYHSSKYCAKWILSFWIAISAIFQNSHLAWLRVLCSAGYHLSCTCAMGKVVDAEGRVKGGEMWGIC